ncbi:hypothetical protein V8G54_026989 [Vigna mungo]|uniref:Radical SAM core domain-containing protein n=1 Tax=Vigna mungo TaxID=3915 RepID=A0AAQ3N1T5_VIGMU
MHKLEEEFPDFRGDDDCVEKVAKSGLDVFAHNIETVEELQNVVRDHRANFKQSLKVLMMAKDCAPAGTLTKTSIMLGCGETPDQVVKTMEKVRAAGVDVMTFGQYMRPSKRHMPVSEYVTPEAFDKYQTLGMEMPDDPLSMREYNLFNWLRDSMTLLGMLGENLGDIQSWYLKLKGFNETNRNFWCKSWVYPIMVLEVGPMVRSSYKAGEFYIKSMIESDRAASPSKLTSS